MNNKEIEKKAYGKTADGVDVDQYTLTNTKGAVMKVITYGGIITHLFVPDKDGKLGDIVLGFDSLEGYEKDSPYFGALVGRVANRIAKGTYQVDGKVYHSALNNNGNSLHGGLKGYDKRVWNAKPLPSKAGPALELTLEDPDGTEGYPGNVSVKIVYTLTHTNVLKIEYSATTDRDTPINLTNHTYWNLRDAGKSPMTDQLLKIYALQYTPVDETQIPTGEVVPVKGTPIDFILPKPIGRDLEAMKGNPAGYDHNLVLDNPDSKLVKGLEVYDPESKRRMQFWTTEPGVQFYSGNFLAGKFKGKDGIAYAKHSAYVFEAQHYPDSINHPKFPSTILHPKQKYHQVTEYRFSIATKSPW